MNTERFWRLWDAGGTRRRPTPTIALDLPACVPGWLLRASAAAVASGCGALFVSTPIQLVAVALAAVLALFAPHAGGAAALVAGGAYLLGTAEVAPFDARGFVLLLGGHLLVQLSRIASSTSWTGLVEVAVLRRALGPFLVIQGFAQGLAVTAALVASRTPTATWGAVVALLLLTSLVWAGLRQVRSGA
ncbi:MAG: hypothetical protein JJE50_03180 [Actinomycetales bacterium]|nr:hypothetical protein [Actinomycetales bacterium]